MHAATVHVPAPAPTAERMGAAGLRAFVRIAERWGLTVEEQLGDRKFKRPFPRPWLGQARHATRSVRPLELTAAS